MAKKRPQPGRHKVEAIPLPLEHELGMQGEMGPASLAELPVNNSLGELTGSAADLAGVTAIIPQNTRLSSIPTEWTKLDEIPKTFRILEIEVAVHPCEL